MKMVSSFTTKTPTIQVKPSRQESNAHPLDQYLLTKRKIGHVHKGIRFSDVCSIMAEIYPIL